MSRRERGYEVGCARAGSNDANPWPACRSTVAIGHVPRPLFMAHENHPNLRRLIDSIKDLKDGPTRIAENDLHPLLNQCIHDNIGAG